MGADNTALVGAFGVGHISDDSDVDRQGREMPAPGDATMSLGGTAARCGLLAASVASLVASVVLGPSLPGNVPVTSESAPFNRGGRLAEVIFQTRAARIPTTWPSVSPAAVKVISGATAANGVGTPPAAFWTTAEIPREWPHP